MTNRIPLDLIEVEKPCPRDWNRMRGSDRERFCDHCQRYVHDLSAMSEADVQNLLCQQAGKLCIRFTRLADGKIQTLDYCPPSGRKGFGWKFWAAICTIAAALGAARLFVRQTMVVQGRMMVPPGPPPTVNSSSPQAPPCQTP